MAATTIANLWVPEIWIRGIDEATRSRPALLSSGAFVQSPILDEIANGGGISATLPFFKDITDTAEGIQVEATTPTINNITGATNVCPVLNRVAAFGAEALAGAVSASDPVGAITGQLGMNRQKRIQSTTVAVLRGLFGFSSAPAGGGILAANRYDAFSETGASPTSDKLIDGTKFNAAAALLGENQDLLAGGAILTHPAIRAALLSQDANSFERVSVGAFTLERYKGIPIFIANGLSRAGGTSGTVFDTYLCGSGAIGYGAKPQTPGIGVSSLQVKEDAAPNTTFLFDRTRYLVHVNGTKWTGSPAGQSATNAELQTLGNWTLAYATADRIPVVCIRTNG